MKDFLGVRNLDITRDALEKLQFQSLSPLARQILRKSDLYSRSALLSSDAKQFQHAARTLAKGYIKLG